MSRSADSRVIRFFFSVRRPYYLCVGGGVRCGRMRLTPIVSCSSADDDDDDGDGNNNAALLRRVAGKGMIERENRSCRVFLFLPLFCRRRNISRMLMTTTSASRVKRNTECPVSGRSVGRPGGEKPQTSENCNFVRRME